MAVDTRERDVRQLARARALMAQGLPYQQASEAAAWEEIKAMRAANPPQRGPDGRIVLDEDEAAFDAAMADAMGQGNLEAAASEIAVEPTVLYRTAPGRVSPATGEADAGEDLYDPEAVAAYRTRVSASEATPAQMDRANATPLYRGGQFLPSPEDEDMYQRGQVYTVNPVTGARGYSPAYPKDLPVGPGEPGRLGRRRDLEQPVIDSKTGLPIDNTQKYEAQFADSPFGPQAVYRPSAAFRSQLDAREAMLRRERLSQAAGVSGDEAASMDLDQLRAAGRAARADAKDARMAEVTRRAMERQNPTALLDDEWRQYVIAQRLLGKQAGPSPSTLRAAELAQPPAPNPLAAAEFAAEREEDSRLEEGRRLAGGMREGWLPTIADLHGYSRYDQAESALRGRGYTPQEINAILGEVFPEGRPLYPWQEREAAERGGR